MKKTNTILDKIIEAKTIYVREQQTKRSLAVIAQELATMTPYTGAGFYETLKAPRPQLKIIAEVKKASPSAGVLREPFSLEDINTAYQAAEQVVAISVITEVSNFDGSEDTLSFFARHNTRLKPLLRKDFIFEPYQIMESKLLGAQAYLLLASLFELEELEELVDLGQSIGLEPLVEVHTRTELKMAVKTNARCIGVNARNLKTFSVDTSVHQLLGELDSSYARIAESGVDRAEHLAALTGIADAVLIGSHFMKAPDIAAAIHDLTGQSMDSGIS